MIRRRCSKQSQRDVFAGNGGILERHFAGLGRKPA